MFPFDQPAPTAFYLVCYLGTLVLHVLPMNYVLAGSTYLACLSSWEAIRGSRLDSHSPLADTLRDWLPFALSIAITAGVAPLLFVQILYKESFYTANLLLFHRWMAILPILIVAFYLLYLQKLKWFDRGRGWGRMAISWGIIFCFAFVAWSWTENHLLSTRGQDAWVAQYESGRLFYGDKELAPRLSLWFLGALPTLAIILAWQQRQPQIAPATARRLAQIALIGLGLTTLAGLLYAFTLPSETRAFVFDKAQGYLAMVGLGALLQAYGWSSTLRSNCASTRLLGAITVGALLCTAAMTVVREVRRLAEIDIVVLHETHADASSRGGLLWFLFFLLINAGLIVGVVLLVRRGLQTPSEE